MTEMHSSDSAGPIPRIGRYEIEPQGSSVTFRTRHMFGLAPVRGTFAVRHGAIDVVDPIAESRVQVDIDTASFHTGSQKRDTDVRSARFLDTDRHPSATFTSQRVDHSGGVATLVGSLTVHGVTAPVSLVGFTIEEPAAGSGGPGSFVARVTTRIDRTEFGLTAARGLAGRYLDVSLRVVCAKR